MNCESCDALLIDLVERELDETRAAEVRAHAETCESCSRSLARLEGGRRAARELVRREPPRLDAVMAAARARAAEVRAAAVEQTRADSLPTPPVKVAPEKEEETSWLDGVMSWLSRWATGPQVAMAALLVLMVGIGVFNLPQFRSHEGAGTDGALVEPDVHAEMGASALDPAQALDLQVDPRTQRVALGGSDAVDPTHDERPTTTIAQAEVAAAEHVAPRLAEAHDEPDQDHDSLLDVEDLEPADSAGRVEDGPLPDVTSAQEQQALVLAPAPAPAIATATTAPAPTQGRPPSTSRSGSISTYDEVERPSTSPAAMMPAAIHHQLRALVSAGRCDEAIPRYRELLTDHPDYADAPRAMIELAECDRRLGRLDDAERWLTRAETFPSVSAEARRARVRITEQQHAPDMPSAAPPQIDTAASY